MIAVAALVSFVAGMVTMHAWGGWLLRRVGKTIDPAEVVGKLDTVALVRIRNAVEKEIQKRRHTLREETG